MLLIGNDGLPEEQTSDPALAKFPGYWCGSAAGQLALVRAEAAYWKQRALQAEAALASAEKAIALSLRGTI